MEGSDALLFWVEETWGDKHPAGQQNLRPTTRLHMRAEEQVDVRGGAQRGVKHRTGRGWVCVLGQRDNGMGEVGQSKGRQKV